MIAVSPHIGEESGAQDRHQRSHLQSEYELSERTVRVRDANLIPKNSTSRWLMPSSKLGGEFVSALKLVTEGMI